MKLNINKACDLSSISVLPPHSRRPNAMTSGPDAYGLGRNQGSQLRSQSQQSFSQGFSQSQISQSSFENLGNDKKFESQERERSSKGITSLAPIMASRDDSQPQLSRASNNGMRRWSFATVPDNGCQVSEELERRLRLLESSLNKLGMILDSVQSDVMQVNRAVKEVSLEMEGIRQKANLIDSSTQQVLREEEDIKARLERSMKIFSDEMMKKTDLDKLDETVSAIPSFTKEIEAQLLIFRREICLIISKNMEVLTYNMKCAFNNLPNAILSREAKSCVATQKPENRIVSQSEMPASSSLGFMRRKIVSKKEELSLKALKPKTTKSGYYPIVKHEESTVALQEQILIESDEESDGSFCCILLKNETGALSKECQLEKEAREETMRILNKARKRKRRSCQM